MRASLCLLALTSFACADDSKVAEPIEVRVGDELQNLGSHRAAVKGFEQLATLNLSSFTSQGCSVGDGVESFHANISVKALDEIVLGEAIVASDPRLDITLSLHRQDCEIDYQAAVVSGSLTLTTLSTKAASGQLSLRLEQGLSCDGQQTTLGYSWSSFVAPWASSGCE